MSTFVLLFSLFVTKILLYFFSSKEIPKKIVPGPKRWTFFLSPYPKNKVSTGLPAPTLNC